MDRVTATTSASTIALAFLVGLPQPSAYAMALAETSPPELHFPLPIRAYGYATEQPQAAFTTETASLPNLDPTPRTLPPVDPSIEQQRAQFDGMLAGASELLDRLATGGVLSDERIGFARSALEYLALWKAPPPTDLSDGSDGDFTLIWRRQGLSASLTFTEDEVIGYAHTPRMLAPLMFEGAALNIPDLNMLSRALG